MVSEESVGVRRRSIPSAGWPLIAALWFAAVGAVATAAFNFVYRDVLPMVPAAAIAAGVVGGPLWWLVVERGTVTYRRGVAVGAATGVLAHPVTWLVLLFMAGFVRPAIGGLPGVARVLGLSLFFGLWGLVLAGWLTVFLGALGGVGLVAARRRVRDRA